MPYFFIRFLEKTLLLSMAAAAAVGPKAGIPSFSRASTIPMARGSSGATTTRPTLCWAANPTTRGMSTARMLTHSASAAMPPLPGQQ